eukprot:CAMPEP_0197194362 /NCGR_PEP_ID=MMETSP1423-20130617/29125_1 /TAXON_ID=476441 /ORGANISM="Pseudo-nitzschia heimii, Strain UNC1101" /LENGTH=65 /DNA_ID=CAMNT_0042647779 /DNA_START=45 /DNA_END=239 /DNA_ORIENTATION=+
MTNSYGGGGSSHHRSGGNRNNNADDPEDAEQKAAERNLIRRCVDYHAPAVMDVTNRLYHKACRSS